MSSRADKALKAQKDKHHAILRELVQEVPNKTCADCLAKGPRWASWNLGVFVCIRCAGIHRNLGVHISKVKSIDLDSWTQEQLEHFLKWGNSRAALYYECYLPNDFARPQGNQAVETFIRNKYEKKLYQKKDGEPEPNTDTRHQDRMKGNTEKENKPPSRRKPEVKEEPKSAEKTILDISKNAPPEIVASAVEATSRPAAVTSQAKSNPSNDLVSLEPVTAKPAEPTTQPCASADDLLNFGAFSDPVPLCQPDPFVAPGASSAPVETPVVNGSSGVASDSAPAEPAKSTKESILSLYGSGAASQQKMYGVPGGVYMQPQQMPQQQMSQQMQQQMPQQMPYGYHSHQQQQAMPNQMQQMNAQMHQMALSQPNQMMASQQAFSQQQMSQFCATAQPSATSASSGFAAPMYTSSATTQMNNVYQQQQHQSMMTGNYGSNMGQNMQGMNAGQQNMQGMNAGWGGGQNMMNGMTVQQQQQLLQQQQLRQQQQQRQQFGAAGQFNMSASAGSSGGNMMNGHAGYTMNNQLWN